MPKQCFSGRDSGKRYPEVTGYDKRTKAYKRQRKHTMELVINADGTFTLTGQTKDELLPSGSGKSLTLASSHGFKPISVVDNRTDGPAVRTADVNLHLSVANPNKARDMAAANLAKAQAEAAKAGVV
jgi:hypothetical protein